MDLKQLQDVPPWEWPEGTMEEVLRVLKDKEHSGPERLIAAELAGETVLEGDDSAWTLLAIVSDGGEDPELRGAAAIALGPTLDCEDLRELDDTDEPAISKQAFDRIQSKFRSLYFDAGVPEEVRRSILEASVHAFEEWHAGAVRGAFGGGDEDWKLTAVFCMQFLRGFDAEITEALKSSDSELFYWAVVAAGNHGVEGTFETVNGLAMNPGTERELRLAAIEALAGYPPSVMLDSLKQLSMDDDEDIAEAALDAMVLADLDADNEWDDDPDEEP